jgi:hypothetical protein
MAEQQGPLGPRTRPPLPPPSSEYGVAAPPGHILICHPGYEEERNIFCLVAYNRRADGKAWIDYNFAYDICMAVTGCSRVGFFTLGKAPNTPKVGRHDGVLVEGKKYFFHLGDDTTDEPEQYPVIRDIRDYRFSPTHVGDHWRAAVPSTKSLEGYLPEACIVSGMDAFVEGAHLIPATEWEYWKTHGLHKYALQPGPRTQGKETSTRSNIIRLSPTLHKMFDAGHFVFIPINGRLQCQWVRASDRAALGFHGRPILGGCHLVSPEYAYLACVHRMIPQMQEEFLERRPIETLVMTSEGQTLRMTGLELGAYRNNQTRNTSPSKSQSGSNSPRKRPKQTEEDHDDAQNSETMEYEDPHADASSDSGIDMSQVMRGRKRTQELEEMSRRDAKKRRKFEPLSNDKEAMLERHLL